MSDRVPASAVAGGPSDDVSLVQPRRLIGGPIDAWFPLAPGDRAFVKPGEAVVRGAPIADRLRDPRTETLGSGTVDGEPQPGDHRTPLAGDAVGRATASGRGGELLFRIGGRWRVATGDHAEPLEAPFGGIVREVKAGAGVLLRSPAQALLGAEALAGPSSGRLEVATGRDGEVRASEIDVGGAGAILVVGARIDAEALTRARAVGVRGIVVATLGVKERREILASERRGRAAVHGLPPFGILVLEGAVRRPIASPMMAVLESLAGRVVAIVGDPPCLVVDDPNVELPQPPADLIRVRSGPLVGMEGTWAGLGGPRRFPAGAILETGLVRFGERPPVAVPIGDLERFV
jgi:hypothetical protein